MESEAIYALTVGDLYHLEYTNKGFSVKENS